MIDTLASTEIAQVAMARVAAPGERRRGRAGGTPNGRTQEQPAVSSEAWPA